MQKYLRLLACATLFAALLNAFNVLSICRAHERVNVNGGCEIDWKVQPTGGSSKDTDLDGSRTAPQPATEIEWAKVHEPAGTPVDEVSGNDSEKPNRDFTGQTSVSEKRVLGSVVLLGESLLPFLENPFPSTAIGDLPRTGSEKPSGDFAEQTSVSGKRTLGNVAAVGESLMPSLKTPLSPEEVMDVAQRVEHSEQTVSARQNPFFKTELNELESRLCREISGIIEQLTLDIDGVKQMLGRVEETVPTKDMEEKVNQRLGRIEESFLKVSDQVRHIDSTTPEIESLEAHFTQLREQVASAQAELRRNSQGVAEIGGAFGSRLDELEGILHEVIAKWDSDQSAMAQRIRQLPSVQPGPLMEHKQNSQEVADNRGAFSSRLDELEGILQQGLSKWGSDQLELAQALNHLQGLRQDPLNDANLQQARHLEPTKPMTLHAKQHPVFYRPNHFEQMFNGQSVASWRSQVAPVNKSENVLQMTILAFKSCVVGVLVTCMVVLGAMMFFVLVKKGHTNETRQHYSI